MESLIIFFIAAFIMYKVSKVLQKSWDGDESESSVEVLQEDDLEGKSENRVGDEVLETSFEHSFDNSERLERDRQIMASPQISSLSKNSTPPPVSSVSSFSAKGIQRKYEPIVQNSLFSEEISEEGRCSIAEDFDIRKAIVYSEILRPRWRDNEY